MAPVGQFEKMQLIDKTDMPFALNYTNKYMFI